jgi:hypothetical protein
MFSLQARGFTDAELRVLLAQMLGVDPAKYPAGRMTYDLRRLRLHGIIERLPRRLRTGAWALLPNTVEFCVEGVPGILIEARSGCIDRLHSGQGATSGPIIELAQNAARFGDLPKDEQPSHSAAALPRRARTALYCAGARHENLIS